jgi:hypothetical protein
VIPAGRVVKIGLAVPPGLAHRIVIDGPAKGVHVRVRIGTETFEGVVDDVGGIVELHARLAAAGGGAVQCTVEADDGTIDAVAIVTHVTDLPPPKPDKSLGDPDEGDE